MKIYQDRPFLDVDHQARIQERPKQDSTTSVLDVLVLLMRKREPRVN